MSSRVVSYARSSLYEVWDKTLTDIASSNKNIYAVHASGGFMIPNFINSYPERSVEVGIAEQNLISITAGIAHMGKTVFAHTLATFLIYRAFEQIRDDIVYNQFHAKLVSSYAGIIAGPWAYTHFAIEDVALMRTLPNMTIVSPADTIEVKKLVPIATEFQDPIYIRLEAEENAYDNEDYEFKLGKAITMRDGNDVTLVAYGAMVGRALKAADILSKKGIDAQVLNMHTIKPLDTEAIIHAKKNTNLIITLEEHQTTGGLGGAVSEFTSQNCPTNILMLGLNDIIPILGKYPDLLRHYKLDPEGIAEQTLTAYKTLQ